MLQPLPYILTFHNAEQGKCFSFYFTFSFKQFSTENLEILYKILRLKCCQESICNIILENIQYSNYYFDLRIIVTVYEKQT